LTRDQQPKEEEMKLMSEFITRLEGYADLEASIIRATKINKVVKAILKLTEIPKESEFQFKDRSKSLLEKWNKTLESAEQPTTSVTPLAGDEASENLTNDASKDGKVEDKHETGEKEAKSEESAADADITMRRAPTKPEPVEERKEAGDSTNGLKPVLRLKQVAPRPYRPQTVKSYP
jgi:hypothetical protein